MVAQNQHGKVFIELLVRTAGNLSHGDEGRAFDVGGGILPRFAHIEQYGRIGGGAQSLQLFYGNFKVHEASIPESLAVGFDQKLQTDERSVPIGGDAIQVLLELVERLGIECEEAFAAGAGAVDQAHTLQNA